MGALILPKLGMCRNGEEAIEKLMSMGARPIGSGHFAKAFALTVDGGHYNFDPFERRLGVSWDIAMMRPVLRMDDIMTIRMERKEVVIKVTRKRDRGALLVAKAAMATAELDPIAPRIVGVVEFSDDTWAIEMERLSPLADKRGGPAAYGFTKPVEPGAPPWSMQVNRTPLPEAILASPFLTLLDQHVRRSNEYRWDIHGDNVMLRDGQPVVTDPIFHNADC